MKKTNRFNIRDYVKAQISETEIIQGDIISLWLDDGVIYYTIFVKEEEEYIVSESQIIEENWYVIGWSRVSNKGIFFDKIHAISEQDAVNRFLEKRSNDTIVMFVGLLTTNWDYPSKN